MNNEAKRCVFARLLESAPPQAVDELGASAMDETGARKFGQGAERTDLGLLYYTKLFRSVEIVKCPVLKKLEAAAGKMLKWKGVGERVALSGVA